MASHWFTVNILLYAAISFNMNRATTGAVQECDFVIVGAGTAGLALAARLEEVEDWKVCVLERGPMEGYMSGWYTNSYKWTSPHDPVWLTQPTLRTMETVQGRLKNGNRDGRMIYIPRWRGRGGTSRVYGAIVRPASPDILDLWPKGWKFDDLLPFYKKSEDHFCHYDTEQSTDIKREDCEYWHGKGGPMQVNPLLKEVFANFSKAFKPICENKTMPWKGYAGDYNGRLDDRTSCSVFQQFKDRTNSRYYPTEEARVNRASTTARGSSYTGYYKYNDNKPTVILDAPVTKILFENGVATGVLYLDGTTGKTLEMKARKEVIVAGGALDTPHLLQISGVGPKDVLEKIKVKLVADNQHVGQNLWDHISVPYVLKLAPSADDLPPSVNINGTEYNNTETLFRINGPFSWIIHYRSNVTGRTPKHITDVQLYVMGNSSLFDETAALCTTSDMETKSAENETSLQGTIRIIDQWPEYRGSINATSPSIFDKPVLDYGWHYKRDNKTSPAFKNVAKVFREQIQLLRKIFFESDDAPASLRDMVLDEVEPGLDKSEDDELDKWIRGMAVSALHPACTCKMPDCVDEFLRVRGVSKLRICDTSAFATQIDGNPAATIFAMSEKLAEMLKDEHLDNIHVAFRQDFAMTVNEGKNKIQFSLQEKEIKSRSKCKDVQTFLQWISTGKDTSALLVTCTLRLCKNSSSPQAIADSVVLNVLENIGFEGGGAEGYPRFNESEAIYPNNRSQWVGPGAKPFVFLAWRQLFPNISSTKLWQKVGRWRNPVPGSVISFKLNCQPRISSELQYYSPVTQKLIYIEQETSFPSIDYIAAKKASIHRKSSSMFYRTASMIAKPNIDWYRDLAQPLLEEVFASSGRRYAQQFPPLASRPGWWYETSYGLLIYQFKGTKRGKNTGEKVAGFALDKTVIETKSGNDIPQDAKDWKFTSPSVPKQFRKNHNGGILNVILTNQLDISLRYQDKMEWMKKVENITAQIGVPLYVVAATVNNEYSKPNICMWTYFNCTLNQFKTINKTESLYVGDAAGRPHDQSDSDKKFAENIGITFYTPDAYFKTVPS